MPDSNSTGPSQTLASMATCPPVRSTRDANSRSTMVFPTPPSLMTQKVRDWPDGRIFHVPMRGQNSMPRYARQVSQQDIWSVIHYIRKLQAELPVAPPADVGTAEGAQP